jgi:hypothetical protein
MRQGLGVDIDRQRAVAETVKLFVLPPLLTFALVAMSLLLFTSHLTREDLRTIFVVESGRQAD